MQKYISAINKSVFHVKACEYHVNKQSGLWLVGSRDRQMTRKDCFTSTSLAYMCNVTQLPYPSSASWFGVVIPLISAVGIGGNLLNVVVLTRRRLLSTMSQLERSVTHGLTALAVSDLLFCLVVLLHPVFYSDLEASRRRGQQVHQHYYGGGNVESGGGSGSGRVSGWRSDTSPMSVVYRLYGPAVIDLMLMQVLFVIYWHFDS